MNIKLAAAFAALTLAASACSSGSSTVAADPAPTTTTEPAATTTTTEAAETPTTAEVECLKTAAAAAAIRDGELSIQQGIRQACVPAAVEAEIEANGSTRCLDSKGALAAFESGELTAEEAVEAACGTSQFNTEQAIRNAQEEAEEAAKGDKGSVTNPASASERFELTTADGGQWQIQLGEPYTLASRDAAFIECFVLPVTVNIVATRNGELTTSGSAIGSTISFIHEDGTVTSSRRIGSPDCERPDDYPWSHMAEGLAGATIEFDKAVAVAEGKAIVMVEMGGSFFEFDDAT